jgi:hypothetical protein
MNLTAGIKSPDDETIGILIAAPKDFKTGSRGFFGNGKLEIES